jgi:hypothetical protein
MFQMKENALVIGIEMQTCRLPGSMAGVLAAEAGGD